MDKTTFVLLSFEGPDAYSRAGGLGVRVADLSHALASLGFETHLFFVGDPDLPGHETLAGGRLHLHRWCQWISRHHPNGVYDGEEGKLWDWNASIPSWLEHELLAPQIAEGRTIVILAEEWHTAQSVIALDAVRSRRGWQESLYLLWNANNTFSFHRIDWPALANAATLTTVSRWMKHVMWRLGVNPRVIPNGIARTWMRPVPPRDALPLLRLFKDRVTLVKVARWDPDKRWDAAIDAVAELKRRGAQPLFLARGGLEEYGHEMLARAAHRSLDVAFVSWSGADVATFAEAVRPALTADMVVLNSHLSEEQRRALFLVANAVLANSGLEPFGLVGLETMSVGGVAFVGATGEDYVTLGHDAISLQTGDPREIVHHVLRLRGSRQAERRLRHAGKESAARYTWQAVIRRVLFPVLGELGVSLNTPHPSHGDVIPFPTVSAGGPAETHILTVATPVGVGGAARLAVRAPTAAVSRAETHTEAAVATAH